MLAITFSKITHPPFLPVFTAKVIVTLNQVLKGMPVVRKIEVNKTDDRNKPIKEVKIVDCGGMKVDKPFYVDLGDALA